MSQAAPKERLRPFKPLRFGRYTLLMPLSTGGMGEIYLAGTDAPDAQSVLGDDALCVIKKILPRLAQDTEFVERFVDEARILVKLSHDNIARVLDMGLHEQAPYLALEFIDGKDLRRVISRFRERGMPIPLSFSLYVTTQVLSALAYAHRKKGDDGRELNLVHRDVSPQNLLISYVGEVKVIDFGLAKSTLSAAKTNPSIVLGKFLYMSPEQARHQRSDRRSDLYAVGLCLYELICGQSPFEGVPPGELMGAVGNPHIAPLRTLEPLCPPALSDAVMKALAPDPQLRFQTAEEFRTRLLSILKEIDPSAGPQTAARLMTEAFAGEYGHERKLLSALHEQVKEADADEDATQRATSDELRPTQEIVQASTLEDIPLATSSATTQEHAAPKVNAEALSFQPTRKAPLPAADRQRPPETHANTPSVVVAEDAHLTVQLSAAIDEDFTPGPTPAFRNPHHPERSTHVKSDPSRRAAARNLAAKTRATPKPAAPVGQRSSETPPTPLSAMTDGPQSQTPEELTAVAPRSGSMLVWMTLPLLAVLAVVGYIAWDVYSTRLLEEQRANDAREGNTSVDESDKPERSREVRIPGSITNPAVGPELTADDLSVPSRAKRPPPSKAASEAKPTSKMMMLKQVRVELERVENGNGLGALKLKLMALETEAGKPGGEAEFQAKVRQFQAEIRSALDRQQ